MAVEIDCVRDPARREVLNVRRLATQHANDLVRLALELERLQVVRKREQVHFRAQSHLGMAPISVGEDAQLSTGRDSFDFVLRRPHFVAGVASPWGEALGQGRGFRGICLRDLQDIDPVKRREVIEVDGVIV